MKVGRGDVDGLCNGREAVYVDMSKSKESKEYSDKVVRCLGGGAGMRQDRSYATI